MLSAGNTAPLLELKGITKRFPGVLALSDVSFSVGQSEVVALIGENGAGKSTLMKTLGGVHQPDEGEIFFDGKNVTIAKVADAIALGIGFVHQELNVLGQPRCGRQHLHGPRTAGRRTFAVGQSAQDVGGQRSVPEAPWPAYLAQKAVERAFDRSAANGRDRQGSLPERAGDHYGRADQLAHPGGNRPASLDDQRSSALRASA